MLNKRLLIMLFPVIALAIIFFGSVAHAKISGVHGIKYSSAGNVVCEENPPKIDTDSYFKAKACSINPSGYVPRSGKYKVKLTTDTATQLNAVSTSAYFDANKNIYEQTITVSGSDVHFTFNTPLEIHSCYVLVDEQGKEWALIQSRGCGGYMPIPPTPPVPSCTLNNNSDLSVDLGTVDRTLLPTTPDAAASKHMQIPVVCTNDNGTTVSVTVQLGYTPITVSGKQIAKSSTNGLGVAVFYNNQTLSPNENKAIQLNTGSNIIDLAFQAVRDPGVGIGDISTGSFSASAVLTMNVL